MVPDERNAHPDKIPKVSLLLNFFVDAGSGSATIFRKGGCPLLFPFLSPRHPTTWPTLALTVCIWSLHGVRSIAALVKRCLHARGSQTLFICHDADSSHRGDTLIHRGEGAAERELSCWLSDGEFIYPLHVGVNTLGRSSNNDVVVEDAYSSRRHCAILVHSSETFELHDTASKNGTYLNGTRLSGPAPLRVGMKYAFPSDRFSS